MNKLEELLKLKTEYDERLKKDGESALKEAFTELFNKYSELESITWIQFTPYFNDGDACSFGVREFDLELSEDAPEEWHSALKEWDGGGYHYGETLYANEDMVKNFPRLCEMQDAVGHMQNILPADLLESIFGDHCKITVTRKSMEVSEFDHD